MLLCHLGLGVLWQEQGAKQTQTKLWTNKIMILNHNIIPELGYGFSVIWLNGSGILTSQVLNLDPNLILPVPDPQCIPVFSYSQLEIPGVEI